MKVLIEEIELFFQYMKYAVGTEIQHRNTLKLFTEFLTAKTGKNIEELHLQEIYEVWYGDSYQTSSPIDTDLVDEFFYLNLQSGRSYHTLKQRKKALSSFFDYLNKNYDFPNVMNDLSFNIKKYKPKEKYKKILNQHDMLKFFQFVSISKNLERDILLFTLIIQTGSRAVSEILNIKVHDINWEDDSIVVVKSKMNKSRTLPLRKGLTTSLKTYCQKNNLRGNDSLFDLSDKQFKDLFYSYLEHANLPRVGIHTFRHSFATFMSEAGTDITVIKQLLDHEELITTEKYIKPNIISNQHIRIVENERLFNKIHQIKKTL